MLCNITNIINMDIIMSIYYIIYPYISLLANRPTLKVKVYGRHEHIQREEGMRTGVPTESPLSERKGKEKK